MKPASDARRWLVLVAVFLANALPEFMWSNFPPIMTVVGEKYSLGPTAASLPIMSFAVGTMLSAGIAGRIIDRKGYPTAIGVGLVMTTVFAFLRCIEGPFWLLVVAQGGIGAAFSLIAASTSSFVVDWFEDRHVSLVTGLCVIGLYVGLGSSMIVTPMLVDHFGFAGMMQATAGGAAVVSCIGVALIRLQRPLFIGTRAGDAAPQMTLLGTKTLTALLAMSFLMGGAFSAVATALEPVWTGRGLTLEAAGVANGLFIFGGIAGSFLIPMLERWFGSGKRALLLCSLVALISTYPLLDASTPWIGYLVATAMGVFWLGNVPVCLVVMERAVGIDRAGAASSAFWAVNNLGTISIVWMFGAITEWMSWRAAALATLCLLALNLIATVALPSDSTPVREAR